MGRHGAKHVLGAAGYVLYRDRSPSAVSTGGVGILCFELVAAYRVFVEGVVLGINSYDQWGVELGKELATALQPIVEGADASGKDGSTAGLVGYLRKNGL